MSKFVHKIFHFLDVLLWVILALIVLSILFAILKRIRKWSEASRCKKCIDVAEKEKAELELQLGRSVGPQDSASAPPPAA